MIVRIRTVKRKPFHHKKEMYGLHKSIPPISPGPYRRTYEVIVKPANYMPPSSLICLNITYFLVIYLTTFLSKPRQRRTQSPSDALLEHLPCSTRKEMLRVAHLIRPTYLCRAHLPRHRLAKEEKPSCEGRETVFRRKKKCLAGKKLFIMEEFPPSKNCKFVQTLNL